VVFLQVGGGLHLYQTPAVFLAAENVGLDDHALVVERTLEDGGDFGIRDKLFRNLNCLRNARAIDLDTAREQPVRKPPDFPPLFHGRFIRGVSFRRRQFRLIHLKIEPLKALAARYEAGF